VPSVRHGNPWLDKGLVYVSVALQEISIGLRSIERAIALATKFGVSKAAMVIRVKRRFRMRIDRFMRSTCDVLTAFMVQEPPGLGQIGVPGWISDSASERLGQNSN
jgi:hypothetical protein